MHCTPFRRRGPTWAFPCESANPLDLVPDLACADWRRVRAVTGRSPAGTWNPTSTRA